MIRNLTLWGTLLGALLLVPNISFAQMDFSLDESAPPEEDGAAEGDAAEGEGMSFSMDEAEGEGGEEGGADFEGDSEGSVIDELAAPTEAAPMEREQSERPTESVEEVYAVQQIYALRLNRVEFAPSAGFVLNDPFMSHPSLSVALNYWWTNVLALGVSFNWYQWGSAQQRESDLNYYVRRSTRLGIPVNDWQLSAFLNFTYVPFYGKFSVFNEFIFQWDAYIVGGVGLMRTRPIPVVDPEIRQFDWQNRIGFNLGIGIRIFLSRFAGIFFEFRDYAFLEKYENLEVSPQTGACDVPGNRCSPDTWFADSFSFSNNITVQVGFTIFFPFTFEYNLPK